MFLRKLPSQHREVSVMMPVIICFQASDDVSKNLSAIKTLLYGSESQEPQPEVVAQLAHEMYDSNMLHFLILNLGKIDFEVGKTTQILMHKKC